MDSNEVKIAILETKIEGIREQQKAHAEETRSTLADLAKKVEEMNNTIIQGRAYGFVLWGIITAAGSVITTLIIKAFDKFSQGGG
jgi:hypothetical protein